MKNRRLRSALRACARTSLCALVTLLPANARAQQGDAVSWVNPYIGAGSGSIGTHQPAIWMGDYGYVTIIPQVGPLETTPEARQMSFRHEDEKVRPDYYSVEMTAKDQTVVRAEMTATERCA